MEDTFENTFIITFNPQNWGDGFFLKQRATIKVVLENVNTVQEAKELLAEQNIFATSIQRLPKFSNTLN
jgi:penicillin V acylase-like amidase (Ntn superfamily)